MNKDTTSWTIESLCHREFVRIDFPEYQREPNVWGRDAKQKLVDSILRRFDVGSLYFYVGDDGVHSCIDGRQRINAVMSFLNMNTGTWTIVSRSKSRMRLRLRTTTNSRS